MQRAGRHTRRLGLIGVAGLVAASTGVALAPGAVAGDPSSPCLDGTTPTLGSSVFCTVVGGYTLTIPAGTGSLSIDAVGGGGGGGYPGSGHVGGDGADIRATVPVPAGATKLRILVGSGGLSDQGGSQRPTGGVASAVIALDAGNAVVSKLVIAGGGGAGSHDGDGGDAGLPGTSDFEGTDPGSPGVGALGGAGGIGTGSFGSANGAVGTNDSPTTATTAAGGLGADLYGASGGGGGGGWGGGGGGGAGTPDDIVHVGGGGGSSLVTPTATSSVRGIKFGSGGQNIETSSFNGDDGSAVITFVAPPGPAAPTAVSATGGNAQATVLWTAPTDTNGSPITGYTATSSPGGLTCIPVPATATSCVVTGLNNGTAYTFTVTATNANGTSSPSSPSNSVTPARAPDPPTGVTAIASAGQAVVSFAAPGNTGGSPIISYTVIATPVEGAGGSNTGCLSTSCTVIGLTNGTTYTFTVTATNAAGTSAASLPSIPVTPATTPGVPTDITVARDGASATISWAAPATGGSAITGYAVSLGGLLSCVPSPPTATSCTVNGLAPTTAYTASVTASNVVGAGAAGTASVAAASVPSAPTAVTVTPTADGNGVVVAWDAPSNNGAAINSYLVTSGAGLCIPAPPTATSCTITPVSKGLAFTYSVVAFNAVGPSAGAVSAPYTLTGVPTVPIAPEYTASATGFRVLFHKPLSDGGSDILGYRYSLNGGATWAELAFTGPSTGPYWGTVTGLTPRTTYQVRLQAYNANGLGGAIRPPAAVTTPAFTVPSAPVGTTVTATATPGQLKLFWHKPFDEGGTPIRGYRVSLNGGATWSAPLTVYGPTTGPYSAFVNGLQPGRTYQVRIQAWNAVGYGGAPRTPVPAAPR
jgi:trimeric autotransporter adhesin